MTRFSAELFAADFATDTLTYQENYPGQESAIRIALDPTENTLYIGPS